MTPPTNAPTHRGLLEDFSELLGAITRYFRLRISLLALEAREAGGHFGLIAGLAAAALLAVFFGYIFLVLAAAFAVAALIGGAHAWLWTALAAALVHLGAAALCAFTILKKLKRPVFTESIDQFRKDEIWLRSKNPN